MRKLVAGTGWKMNIGAAAARRYAAALRQGLAAAGWGDGDDAGGVELFVLPPFTSLAAAQEALAGSPVGIGGQTMHWEAAGAWTGEIAAPMLIELGCRYVELAHSERLQHFGESYELVRRKVNSAMEHGLTPILCLGETADDKAAGRSDAVLAAQLDTAIADQPAERVASIILAYEPRWAIGAATAATPDYVAARHGALRQHVDARFGAAAARRIRIVYGGSVTAANGAPLIALDDVDGLFVGRAAWTPEGFLAIATLVRAAALEKERKT